MLLSQRACFILFARMNSRSGLALSRSASPFRALTLSRYVESGNIRTKTGKSRVVLLESGLANKLAALREKNPTTRLVFGTNDKVDGHYLRICKAIA